MASRTDNETGCRVWTGQLHPDGYGMITFRGKRQTAHRLAYIAANGPIPTDMEIDHSCRNRACVNVEHLRARTKKQNAENVGPSRRSKTGVRSVYQDSASGRYRVSVTHNRRTHHGGSFRTLGEADEAARALRNRLFTNNLADRREGELHE